MAYSPESYRHELDQRAFELLNTFPKFVKLCEAYNANYKEVAASLDNMSESIRLGENQLPEIYTLLPPICEKLGIDVPELYYQKSKEMNAWTFGTVKPYIMITSKLVDNLTPTQISSVIAHECGHIACKHSLYHSMANYLIDGIENSPLYFIPAIRKYLSPTLVRALRFWSRCSELSADRAAVLCDNSAEPFIDALLKIRGYGDDINRVEFIKQALDLKEILEDSKSTKALAAIMNQWDRHPTLATRAYECYEWAKTDIYKQIIDGTYTPQKEEKKEEKEVVAAEIKLDAKDKKDEPINVLNIPSGEAIDVELARVNSELERYTNEADKVDYAFAVCAGIYTGVIDSIFIGQCVITPDDIVVNHRQVNEFIQKYAKSRGIDKERLNRAIAGLEEKFKVEQDGVWNGKGFNITPGNHHLADFAHHPTPIGLLSSIVVQFLRMGTFVNRDGELHFIPVETTFKDILEIYTPAIVTGVLNWIAALDENKYEEESGDEIPEALKRIIHLAASTPLIIEVAKCADNWFGHLVSDLGGSSSAKHGGAGIPGIFISLLYEVSGLPILKDSGLPGFVNDLYTKGKWDFRHELSIYKNLGKQAIPVAFNEIFVRTTFLVTRLANEIIDHGIKKVNWNKVFPFKNRTIDRMMMISSMTFNMADTADAAVHAAVESCGNWVLFSGVFVSRFNYVGAGRAALAIVKEVSNEKKEMELIHQKLILTEAKTVGVIEQMQGYRDALEQRVSDYLAEDLEEFLEGFDYVKQGLNLGDSELVIKGNVVIQRVLGREPQFTNQKEFDDLMESDEVIVF